MKIVAPPTPLNSLEPVIANVVRYFIGFAGLVFFFYLIIAGYNYLNAGSNKEAAAKARNSLTYAFLGLIISLSAWILIDLLGRFLGITNFTMVNICIVPPC